MDALWSTGLLIVIIKVLLMIGGIELNPGPPKKDPNSTLPEDEITPTMRTSSM